MFTLFNLLASTYIANYPVLSEQPQYVKLPDIIKRINSGDCGTFSLCVGHELTSRGYNIEYFEFNSHRYNSGHAVIKYDGKFYDSLYPNGLDDIEDHCMYKEDSVLKENDYDNHFESWIHETDTVGLNMVKQFPALAKSAIEEIYSAKID